MKKWVVNGCAYYEDVTDINVGSIKEAIKQLEDLKEDRLSFVIGDKEHDKIYLKDIQAIETVLGNLEVLCDMQITADRELKNLNKINEEHQKINGELREKIKELDKKIEKEKKLTRLAQTLTDESIKEALIEFEKDYISKQTIKDKIEKIFDVKIHNYNYLADTDWNYSQEQVDRQVASILKRILDEVLDELLQENENKNMNLKEAIKNLKEIVELAEEEINNNDVNVTAILDLKDLKSLQIVIDKLESEDK